jgi:hypothetical protein
VGMDAACHDRLVWTDDDFHHPPDWLEIFNADYERHGPVSEVPYFVGRDPLSVLWEPLYASTALTGHLPGKQDMGWRRGVRARGHRRSRVPGRTPTDRQ